MIKNDIKISWLARNASLMGTALFGLVPAIALDTTKQFEFYYYILILSWISMATFSVEAFANIRFPQRKQKYVPVGAYIAPILASSAFVTLFLIMMKTDVLTDNLLVILLLGNISNIKLVYLSWLRAYYPRKANFLMFVDGFAHLFASVLIYSTRNDALNLILVFSLAKLGPLFLIIWDLILSNLKLKINRLRKRYIKIVAVNSLKLFVSSIILVYGMTGIKTFMLATYTDSEFVAASIALSVTANIQKFILTYYWVLQKHVFAGSKTYKSDLKYAVTTALNVVLALLITILALSLIQSMNSDLTFGTEILWFCFLISGHRIIVSAYRLHVLKKSGVHKAFMFQISSLILNALILGITILGSYRLPYVFPLIFLIDLLISCIFPLSGLFKFKIKTR